MLFRMCLPGVFMWYYALTFLSRTLVGLGDVFVDRFLVWVCFPVPSGGIVCFLFQK